MTTRGLSILNNETIWKAILRVIENTLVSLHSQFVCVCVCVLGWAMALEEFLKLNYKVTSGTKDTWKAALDIILLRQTSAFCIYFLSHTVKVT